MTTDARPPAAASPAASTGAASPTSAPGPEPPAAPADPRPGGRVALDVTLPRAAYVDPAVFAEERERIFVREWFCVGREEELPNPGDYLSVEVAGESVVVVRGVDGALHGHYNVCRHRGCQVTLAAPNAAGGPSPADPAAPGRREAADPPGPTGAFAGNRIRCPYHSWTYELDGRVRTAPFLSDRDDFDRAAFALHPVGVAAWAGFVFVNLEPGEARSRGHDLASQLGEIPGRVARYPLAQLRIARRIVYEVRANWKVILENYNECYHCSTVHPGALRARPGLPEERRERARLGGRDPAPRGRLDLHSKRHHEPRAVRGPRRGRADTALRGARLPEPHAVAGRGPRGRLHALADGTGSHDDRLRCPRPPVGDAEAGLRPDGRRRVLGPGQRPGLDDLRGDPARDDEPRLHPRLLRADGGPLGRHAAIHRGQAGAGVPSAPPRPPSTRRTRRPGRRPPRPSRTRIPTTAPTTEPTTRTGSPRREPA